MDPTAHTITVDAVWALPAEQRDQAASLHRSQMGHLLPYAMVSHQLHDYELYPLLDSRSVLKIRAVAGGELIGLGLMTNDLQMVPALSVPFVAARYSDEYIRKTIWFAVGTVVREDYTRSRVFQRIGQAGAQKMRELGAEVLLWDAALVRYEIMSEWVGRAIESLYGTPVEHEELEVHRFMGTRFPATTRVTIDLDELSSEPEGEEAGAGT